MVIDKKEHKVLLQQLIENTQFPGKLLELACEVKRAIQEATVPEDK